MLILCGIIEDVEGIKEVTGQRGLGPLLLRVQTSSPKSPHFSCYVAERFLDSPRKPEQTHWCMCASILSGSNPHFPVSLSLLPHVWCPFWAISGVCFNGFHSSVFACSLLFTIPEAPSSLAVSPPVTCWMSGFSLVISPGSPYRSLSWSTCSFLCPWDTGVLTAQAPSQMPAFALSDSSTGLSRLFQGKGCSWFSPGIMAHQLFILLYM